MRRFIVPLLTLTVLGAGAGLAIAQDGGSPPPPDASQKSSDARKEEKNRQDRINKEFEQNELPVPNLDNAGPCPYVKVLYDASRFVEFASAQKTASNVAYSGEIEGVSSTCHYKAGDPITVEMLTTFAIGKGSQGVNVNKPVRYWVAVTDRDKAILGKQTFDFTAHFPTGSDRVLVFEHTSQIVIPRANKDVSGEAFEVLVGFEVTPEQAAFNRDGNRFLVNANGQTAQAPGSPPAK